MGNMLIVRDPARLQEWGKRIETCKSSGRTVADWCRENGINEKTYYYWNKRVRMADAMNSAPGGFYEIPNAYKASGSQDVVGTVSVGFMKADIYRGADAETLSAILKAMRQC